MSKKQRQLEIEIPDGEIFDVRVAEIANPAIAEGARMAAEAVRGWDFAALKQKPALRLLRFVEVSRRVTLGRSAIYALIAQDGFPKPVKLTPRRSAWVESEIDAWVEQRMQGRRIADPGEAGRAMHRLAHGENGAQRTKPKDRTV